MSVDQLGPLADLYEKPCVSDWHSDPRYDPDRFVADNLENVHRADRLLMFVLGFLSGGVLGWLCGVWV